MANIYIYMNIGPYPMPRFNDGRNFLSDFSLRDPRLDKKAYKVKQGVQID